MEIEFYDKKEKRHFSQEIGFRYGALPHYQQIMPATGFLAVWNVREEPWITTEPVIAWALVTRYEPGTGGACVESREIEPLTYCELGLESPVNDFNFLRVIPAENKEALEQARTEARTMYEKSQTCVL